MSDAPTPRVFKVGDAVTWTHVTRSGHSMGFRTREGKIISLNNVTATMKMRNGRTDWSTISSLTPAGEQTELTKSFLAAAKATEAQ